MPQFAWCGGLASKRISQKTGLFFGIRVHFERFEMLTMDRKSILDANKKNTQTQRKKVCVDCNKSGHGKFFAEFIFALLCSPPEMLRYAELSQLSPNQTLPWLLCSTGPSEPGWGGMLPGPAEHRRDTAAGSDRRGGGPAAAAGAGPVRDGGAGVLGQPGAPHPAGRRAGPPSAPFGNPRPLA